MARVIVIGGTGHIGTFLVPRLVRAGHSVISVSRGERQPYVPDAAWVRVEQIRLDRNAEEAAGTFGRRIAELGGQVVVDLTCYTLESARQLVEGVRGRVRHLLHCGTIWIHGAAFETPLTEEDCRNPMENYGRRKLAIEDYLLTEASREAFATLLHPGHLVGPGWAPINPVGNFNLQVFADLANGRELLMPNFGRETVHHVHADDVAQSFELAIARPQASTGQAFHVVSPAAVTLAGFASVAASWWNRDANLRFVPWEEWRANVSERDAGVTWSHMMHSPSCSIEKARRLLGYEPRYRSAEAVKEAVFSLIESGALLI